MRHVLGVVMLALALVGPGALAKDPAVPSTQNVAPKEGDTLTIKRGETKTVAFQDITRVAVGDPEIADIEVNGPNKLVVKGGTEGKTTLLVWTKDKKRHAFLIDVK
jgi:pilus assembly protein CpaC